MSKLLLGDKPVTQQQYLVRMVVVRVDSGFRFLD